MSAEQNENKTRVKQEARDFVTEGVLGSREWKQSKLWYLTGLNSVAAGAKRGLTGVGSAGGRTVRLVKSAFRRDQEPPLKCDSADPRVRFGAAMERYGLDESNVDNIQRSSTAQSFAWMVIVLALTIWGIYQLGSAQGIGEALFGFVCHIFAVPMMIRQLFWNWQIRNRALRSFSEFSRSGDWFPPVGLSGANAAILALLGASAMMMFPSAAMAQDGALAFLTDGAEQAGTLYYELLQVLAPVGPVEPGVIQSPWAGPLSNAMQVFNTTLLAVGGAMLGWHTMSGMVATAHEGKMLGQKWHQIWAPVRVTAGVGFLVPVSGGFSAIQLIVLQVALWGSAMADQVWDAYTDSFRDTAYMTNLLDDGQEYYDENGNLMPRKNLDASIKDFVNSEESREFVINLLERQVCLAGVERAIELTAQSYINRGIHPELPDDISNLSDEHATAFLAYFRERAPSLAAGISATGEGGSISFFEVMTQAPAHKIGMSTDEGRLLGSSVPPGGEATKMFVEQGGTAVVGWNFGICGNMNIDVFDIGKLEETLAVDPSSYQDEETFLGMGTGDYGEVNWSQLNDDLALHLTAYNLIMNSAQNIGARIDAEVMPLTQQAAEIVANAAMYRGPGEFAPQDFQEILMSEDGAALEMMAAAYQAWKDIISEERASVRDNVYDLVDVTSIEPYIDVAQEKGWSSAGSFYMILARAQENNYNIDTISANFENGFTSSDDDSAWMSLEATDKIKEIFHGGVAGGLIPMYRGFASYSYTGMTNDVGVIATEIAQREIDENTAWMSDYGANAGVAGWLAGSAMDKLTNMTQKAGDAMARGLMNAILHLEPDPYFALTAMVDLGQVILNVAFILLAISILGSLLSGTVTGVVGNVVSGGFASKVLEGITGLLQLVGLIILILGVVHAYILPMVPYVMWSFFVLGMIILIAEAMVAAPIWALMHVRMDGSEFVDQIQRPGYMIVFNLFLRPTLAIFGLILSYSVFSAGVWFMNETFEIAMRGTMFEGMTVVGVLVMLAVMTYMHYQIAIRSFSLITEVPDRVTRWFGQGGEQLGESEEAKRTVGMFVGNAENKFKEAGGYMGGKAKGQDKPESRSGGQETGETGEGGNKGGSQRSSADLQTKT